LPKEGWGDFADTAITHWTRRHRQPPGTASGG